MIQALSNLVVGGLDLIEAEGRLARVHLVRLAALTAVLLASALVSAAASVCVGAGVVLVLEPSIGLGPALIWTGAAVIVVCAALTALGWRNLRSEHK